MSRPSGIAVNPKTKFSTLPGHALKVTGFVCSRFSDPSNRACECSCGGALFNASSGDEAEEKFLVHLREVEASSPATPSTKKED